MSARAYYVLRQSVAHAGLCLLMVLPAALAADQAAPQAPEPPPPLLLDGGRRLEFIRAFSAEQEVKSKHAFWNKLVDVIAGAPERTRMIRPYDIVTDSRGRIIVSDPGAALVHIFDFENGKYQKLAGSAKEPFKSPMGVAVDNGDNIYVADSELGKLLVFDSRGKFCRDIGNLKGGEGYFKRPTGVAVDAPNNRVYVTDTLRDAVYYTDLEGNILGHFGSRGSGPGEFNFPTELLTQNGELFVVDAMNFRVQIFDGKGQYHGSFGQMGMGTGYLWRAKGLAMDNEGHFYVADAMLDAVQVFDREGTLLYYFGHEGDQLGEFDFPAGISIDRNYRVYVVDMLNCRVEVFQYMDRPKAGSN